MKTIERLKRNYSLWIFALALGLNAPSILRAESTGGPGEGFRAAFDACAEKTTRPEPGSPPSAEFDACMKAAGFERPAHPPRGGKRGPGGEGRPPRGEKPSEAQRRCQHFGISFLKSE